MGFQRSTLKLEFDPSTEFVDLVVRMRRLNVGELVTAANISYEANKTGNKSEKLSEIVDILAPGLLSWNYEDEKNNPVPATKDGLMQTDVEMLVAILSAWVDVAASVPPPLKVPSGSGMQFPVESIPMELLSASQPN